MNVTEDMKLTFREEIAKLVGNRITDIFTNHDIEELLTTVFDTMPKQEPVGYANRESITYLAEGGDSGILVTPEQSETRCVPLYTHPQPKREPLSKEEVCELWNEWVSTSNVKDFVRYIEQAHGIGVEE